MNRFLAQDAWGRPLDYADYINYVTDAHGHEHGADGRFTSGSGQSPRRRPGALRRGLAALKSAVHTAALHMPQIQEAWTTVTDAPQDLNKLGYTPAMGTSAHTLSDPLLVHAGIPTHMAAAIVSKLGARGLIWLRKYAERKLLGRSFMYAHYAADDQDDSGSPIQPTGAPLEHPPDDALVEAAQLSFPDADVLTASDGYIVRTAGREVTIRRTAPRSVVLEFGHISRPMHPSDDGLGHHESASSAQRNSMVLVRGLQSLAELLAAAGYELSYATPSDVRRARVYADVLASSGYVPEAVSRRGFFIWRPAAWYTPDQAAARVAELELALGELDLPERYGAQDVYGRPLSYAGEDDYKEQDEYPYPADTPPDYSPSTPSGSGHQPTPAPPMAEPPLEPPTNLDSYRQAVASYLGSLPESDLAQVVAYFGTEDMGALVEAYITDQEQQQWEQYQEQRAQYEEARRAERQIEYQNLASASVSKIDPVSGGGVSETYVVKLAGGGEAYYKPTRGDRYAKGGVPPGTYARREAAAYGVAAAMGMDDLIPPTVVRERGLPQGVGSVQAARSGRKQREVDYDARFGADEADLARAAVLDYVLGSSDRHTNNWLIGDDGKLILIDNSLSLPVEYRAGDYFRPTRPDHFLLLREAAARGLPLPNLHGLASRWPDVENALRAQGIEEEAITLARERFAEVVSGQYATVGDLPAFWSPGYSVGGFLSAHGLGTLY